MLSNNDNVSAVLDVHEMLTGSCFTLPLSYWALGVTYGQSDS